MRRLVTVLILLAAAGALAYRLQAQQITGAFQDVAALRTDVVRRDDIVVSVRATGRVAAEQTAQLTFSQPGRVEAVLVEVGQAVEAGDVLARLESEPQRIAVEQAEWALRIAELNLELLQAPPSERDLAAAQANVNAAWTAYTDLRDNSIDPDVLRIAELRYEQAVQAQADAAVIYRESNGSELTQAQLGASGFSIEIARLQLEQLRAGPTRAALNAALGRVAQAQGELRRLEAGPTPAQLDQAALAIDQARLRLERAQAALDDMAITAPFSAVVTQVNVQRGGLAINTGLSAVALADLSPLHVVAEVDEIDIARIAVGLPVTITLDALPDAVLAGQVERIAEAAIETGGVIAFEVRVRLDDTMAPARAGMTAAAEVIIEQVDDVLVVSNIYVRLDRRSGAAYVNVVDAQGNLTEREVTLGVQNETLSQVTAGLQAGMVIAIGPDAGVLSIFGDEQ